MSDTSACQWFCTLMVALSPSKMSERMCWLLDDSTLAVSVDDILALVDVLHVAEFGVQ